MKKVKGFDLAEIRRCLQYAGDFQGKIFYIVLGENLVIANESKKNKKEESFGETAETRETVSMRLETTSIFESIGLLLNVKAKITLATSASRKGLAEAIARKYNNDAIAQWIENILYGVDFIQTKTTEYYDNGIHIAEKAARQGAEKIIYLTNVDGIFDNAGELIGEMSIEQAKEFEKNGQATGSLQRTMLHAISAIENGVPRVHILNGTKDGVLLLELFTSKGVGTMIYGENPSYQETRWSETKEVPPILRLLQEQYESLLNRWPKHVAWKNFAVFSVDQQVVACMGTEQRESRLLISHFAIMSSYEDSSVEIFKNLLEFAVENAKRSQLSQVFIEEKTNPVWLKINNSWLSKLGFKNEGENWIKNINKD